MKVNSLGDTLKSQNAAGFACTPSSPSSFFSSSFSFPMEVIVNFARNNTYLLGTGEMAGPHLSNCFRLAQAT